MSDERKCKECSVELPADAPQGLCPQCLMKQGLQTNTEVDSGQGAGVFLPPEPGELAEKFPQLEILELLGQGGMGVVYKARQKQLDRLVALKILPPVIGQETAFAERFTREAQSLARLNHPHIVTIHDFGKTADGSYYFFVMEYVDGLNLREIIEARNLGPSEALKIVPQICEALEYAHQEGIVHRDIKPENILLDKKGHVKIADFGLARLLDKPAAIYTLTRAGQRMGTPQYMAPEQLERPHEVDHRADIYSLGVVFYEMLTGELPLGVFAPPSKKVEVDVRLDDVVLRTLEKDPERRYQHASELKTEVEIISETAGQAQAAKAFANSSTFGEAARKVRIPAIGLMIAGVFSAFSLLLTSGLFVLYLGLSESGAGKGPGLMEIMILSVPVLPGFIVVLGAWKMRKLQCYGLAVTACILACIPYSFGFVIGLAMGIWGLVVLTRPEVQAGFERKKRQLQAGQTEDAIGSTTAMDSFAAAGQQVTGPAVGMVICAIVNCILFVPLLSLLAPALAYRAGNTMTSGAYRFLIIALPCFVVIAIVILLIIASARMRQLKCYRLAVFTAVLAILPVTPAFLLSLPIGIWALAVLTDSQVKAAFKKNKCERSAGAAPEESE